MKHREMIKLVPKIKIYDQANGIYKREIFQVNFAWGSIDVTETRGG